MATKITRPSVSASPRNNFPKSPKTAVFGGAFRGFARVSMTTSPRRHDDGVEISPFVPKFLRLVNPSLGSGQLGGRVLSISSAVIALINQFRRSLRRVVRDLRLLFVQRHRFSNRAPRTPPDRTSSAVVRDGWKMSRRSDCERFTTAATRTRNVLSVLCGGSQNVRGRGSSSSLHVSFFHRNRRDFMVFWNS